MQAALRARGKPVGLCSAQNPVASGGSVSLCDKVMHTGGEGLIEARGPRADLGSLRGWWWV
jgi:hypothetical protein